MIFSSLTFFPEHAVLSNINLSLLGATALALKAGGIVGAWRLLFKFKSSLANEILSVVLYGIAIKMSRDYL